MDNSSVSLPWDVVQWLLTAFLGLLSTAYGGITIYVVRELSKLSERIDRTQRAFEDKMNLGDSTLRQSIENIKDKVAVMPSKDELAIIQRAIEEDRRLAASDRANIAVMMATKNDLGRQLDQQLERFFERFELMLPAIRGKTMRGAPGDD